MHLHETDAELALREGKAPESVKCIGNLMRRRTTKEDSHRMSEDTGCEDGEYVKALAQKQAVYVVEGERMHVDRQDRRLGGAGYKTARAALKAEAQVAVELWQHNSKRKKISRRL